VPLGALPGPLREALERCEEGGALERGEAYALAKMPWALVGPALLRAAARKRLLHKAEIVSYSRKVFIPLTNLCRDVCGYCAYRKEPGAPGARSLLPEQVLTVAEWGRRAGCTEALFMTGERPEQRYPEAKAWLRRLGYASFIEYLRDMCEKVVKRTGLLPHSNPGTMRYEEMKELKQVNASLGLMLESVSERLCRPGGPHEGAPSKHPRARLAVLENAGRLRIPFTTGLLLGIGEYPEELVDGLFAIRELHERYGHIQEVIIQNFRAKPGTPMALHPEPSQEYMLRAIALARLILPGEVNVQAPPNLTEGYAAYLDAGINDWGGISPLTADYVNPEAPWPSISALRRQTEAKGSRLRHRLPIYPDFILRKREYLPEGLREAIYAAAGEDGFARREVLE